MLVLFCVNVKFWQVKYLTFVRFFHVKHENFSLFSRPGHACD
jgi:hypothetical protein